MQKLGQLEKSVERLLEQYRALKISNRQLHQEKKHWQEEKRRLLAEIDRILEGLDDIDEEAL